MMVKEIFGPTLQGEGSHTGTPCVFIRFSNCNAWSGEEKDKEKSLCPYCDTDFKGGTDMTPSQIMAEVQRIAGDVRHVVFSGGEPTIQPALDVTELIHKLKQQKFYIQVETNGIKSANWLYMVDWVTCSPKLPEQKCKIQRGVISEVKVLFPHPNPAIRVEDWLRGYWEVYVQPVWPDFQPAVQKVLSLSGEGKRAVRLSLQTHKLTGVM